MPIFGVAPTHKLPYATTIEKALLSNRIIHDFRHAEKELKLLLIVLLSVIGHFIVIGLVILALYIAAIFGWNMMQFERPQAEEIEFQLVEAPEETPEKPTHIVSTQNSRAGGKVDTPHPKQALKSAGKPKATLVQNKAHPTHDASPTPHPNRAPAVTRPQVNQPTPAKQQQTTQESGRPAPPRPRVSQPTAPKMSTASGPPSPNRISMRPNTTGIIAAPSSGGTSSGTIKAGPIVGGMPSLNGRGNGNSSSVSSAGNTGPGFAAGQFSKRPGGNIGGGNGPLGQRGNNGSNRGNQLGGGSQAGTGNGPVNARRAVDLDPWKRSLEKRIMTQWNPPSGTGEIEAHFTLTVAKDGRLVGRNLTASSSNADYDTSCKLAIDRAAPYLPLPFEYDKNIVKIDFTCSQHQRSY